MCKFQFPIVIQYQKKNYRITHTLWNLLCLSLTAACQSIAWLGIIFFENVNLNTTLKQLGKYHLVSILHMHACMHTHTPIHTQTRKAMYVYCNIVVCSCNNCCNGKVTMHFVFLPHHVKSGMIFGKKKY